MSQSSRIPVQGSPNQDNTSRIFTNGLLTPVVAAAVTITPQAFSTLVNFPGLNANMTLNVGVGTPTTAPFTGDEIKLFFANQSIVAAPTIPVLVGSTTGGTLAASAYFYKITAITAAGETMPSPEATVTTTGATGSVGITWTAIPGATSYKVYRGTVTNTENVFYTSLTNSFTDTGAANTAGTVPAAATYTVTLGTGVIVTAATLAIPTGKTGNITLSFNGALWMETARSITV